MVSAKQSYMRHCSEVIANNEATVLLLCNPKGATQGYKMPEEKLSKLLPCDDDERGIEGYLAVRPGAHVLNVSADLMQIVFPNYSVTLRSPSVVTAAIKILEILQEPRLKSTAISYATSATALTESFIDYVMATLIRSRCLVAVSPDRPVNNDLLGTFYSYITDDPVQTCSELAAARPLFIHFDRDAITPVEMALSAGLQILPLPAIPGSSCLGVLAAVRERLSEASCLAVWGLPYRHGLTASLNNLAIENNMTALFGACEGLVGRVGPCVIPQNTACLECATARLLSHAGKEELQVMTAYRTRFGDVLPQYWPSHPVFERMVLAQFLLELTRLTVHLAPQTIGGLLEYGFGDGTGVRHPVYRVPRCAACHTAHPQRLPWDVVTPGPGLKRP
jgi:bacteriocin biosynthesis cyclodehydratase domain-containing protein